MTAAHEEKLRRDGGVGWLAGEVTPLGRRGVDLARASHSSGVGLGLSLVKRIVEDHGGKVHAKAAGNGEGTIFAIELPIEPRAESVTTHDEPPTVAG